VKNVPWLTIVFLLGLAAIAAGFAIVHPAAGLVVGGALAAYTADRLDATAPAGDAND
jgi:hypothetical protein